LNWIDFGARQYMPDVPHFTTIDPHSERYECISPFSYVFDNPINYIDLKGKDPGDVVILFAGANLNPLAKDPYGITTQIKKRLEGNLNGGKVEKFISNYSNIYDNYETGGSGLPIGMDQNLDELTQEAYSYIKNNVSKSGKVAIYGYSWGGVLATHLSKRLAKDKVDITSMIIIDAANGPNSDEVDRNFLSNVKNFTNVYQESERFPVYSRGYSATKSSSKTAGQNVKVNYVKNESGNWVNASHTNIDNSTLNSVVNQFVNFLNTQNNVQKK
jgi:hypothetical protein